MKDLTPIELRGESTRNDADGGQERERSAAENQLRIRAKVSCGATVIAAFSVEESGGSGNRRGPGTSDRYYDWPGRRSVHRVGRLWWIQGRGLQIVRYDDAFRAGNHPGLCARGASRVRARGLRQEDRMVRHSYGQLLEMALFSLPSDPRPRRTVAASPEDLGMESYLA